MKDIAQYDIRRAAMDLLARREHSRLELRQKLDRRFPGRAAEIETEVEALAEEGLQSDGRLTEAFIRSKSDTGLGPERIRAELRRKGIDNDVIATAMEACGIDWRRLALAVAEKKFPGEFDALQPVREADARSRARVTRFLQQRGFGYDDISAVCRKSVSRDGDWF